MDLSQTLLQQVVKALKNVKYSHDAAIKLRPAVIPTSDQQDLKDHLLAADSEMIQQLSLAVPISELYAAKYAGELHRYARVSSLLEECCSRFRVASEAFTTFVAKTQAEYAETANNQFQSAGNILERVTADLKKILASRSIPNAVHDGQAAGVLEERNEVSMCSDESNTTSPLPTREHALDIVKEEKHEAMVETETMNPEFGPLAAHLRRRSRYEPGPRAACLMNYLTKQELKYVVVEKLTLPFQRFPITEKPIYQGLEGIVIKADPESQLTVKADPKPFRFDSINAVWHSLLAAGLATARRKKEYEDICVAARSVKILRRAARLRDGDSNRLNPLDLARGLRAIDMTLGIIFKDSVDVIIWPLGKPGSKGVRKVIICCDVKSRMFSYEGIKLLRPGQKPMRPPGVQRAFSDTGCLLWRPDMPWKRFDISLGPFRLNGLSSILAIARQSSPGWKPFPLLRLPPELRNKIYEEYLSYKNNLCAWTYVRRVDGYMKIPELCMANHQLLAEVCPLHLARRVWIFDVGKQRTLSLNMQPLFQPYLKLKKIELCLPNHHRVTLHVQYGEPRFKIEYGAFPNTDKAKSLLQPQQLEALVKILAEDTAPGGFGLAEMVAINDYIFAHEKRQKALQRT